MATDTVASLLHQLVQVAERRLERTKNVPGQDIPDDERDILLIDVLNARLEYARYVESQQAKGVN